MDNQTLKENNTMQFKPDKVDSINIYETTMIKCNSYYFSNGNRKLFNSKIKRVLLVDTSEDRKNSKSNLFSIYGTRPYEVNEVITVLLEEVQHIFNDSKEYKIIVLHNNKMLFDSNNNYSSYELARKELNRLEEELKTSLDCLDSFK
jgi:hypothetical protein